MSGNGTNDGLEGPDVADLVAAGVAFAGDQQNAWGRLKEALQTQVGTDIEIPDVRGDRQREIARIHGLFNPAGMTGAQVARAADYDEPNTYTVLDSLVKTGVLEKLEGRPRRWRMSEKHRTDRVLLTSRLIRAGEWTTYGDVAVAVYGNIRMARAVGQSAAYNPAFANPHRVLAARGKIPPGWQDGADGGPEVCRQRLMAEKVEFVDGHANRNQYVGWEELKGRFTQAQEEKGQA